MALAGLESTTGTAIYVAVGEPAGGVYDAASLAALTWEKIVGTVTFGEWGDSENDVTEPLLSEGRISHVNGAADGGEVSISVQRRDTDSGADLIRSNSGADDIMTVLKVYRSGDGEVASGVFTSPRYREAGNDSVRGFTSMMRVNSRVVELSAADVATVLA